MISIIIPTKEEPYINELIKDIHKKVKAEHEIIVVDKSKKRPVIKGARLLIQKSNGLGNAVVEGIKEAKGDYIVMMDGDGSHDPVYINQLHQYIRDYDIVVCSKYVPGGCTEDYKSRVFISKLFNFVIGKFLWLRTKDLMSGYAMFRKEIFNRIKLRPSGYKLLLEVIYKSKARVKEVPHTFHKRKAGKSKLGFGFKEVWRIFVLTMKLKLKIEN